MDERQPQDAPQACDQCGTAYAAGQRRCTNCGAAVGVRRSLPRRTPMVVALAVAAVAGGAVVVAQAEVTERAGAVASTTPDAAAAPIPIAGAALPEATRPTNTPPKPDPAEDDGENALDIPSLDDVIDDPIEPPVSTPSSPDGEPVDADQPADPDDLGDVEKIKVKKAFDFNPDNRPGAEFGKPKAAVDKRSRTVWDVNVPADGQPFGVGIVLDLGETKKVSELKFSTPTPGFGADVYRADAEDRPEKLDDTWTRAEQIKKVSDELAVPLADEPVWTRYILVLLTTPRDPADTRVAIGNLEVLP